MRKAQLNATLKELLIALLAFSVLFFISTSLYAMMKEKSHEEIKDAAGLLNEFSRSSSNIIVVSGREPTKDEINKLVNFTILLNYISNANRDDLTKYLKNLQQKPLKENVFVVVLPYNAQIFGIKDFEVLDWEGTLRLTLQSGNVIDFTNALQNVKVFINTSANNGDFIYENSRDNSKYIVYAFRHMAAAPHVFLLPKKDRAFFLQNSNLYFICGTIKTRKEFQCGLVIFKESLGSSEEPLREAFMYSKFDAILKKHNIKIYEFDVQKFLDDYKNGK